MITHARYICVDMNMPKRNENQICINFIQIDIRVILEYIRQNYIRYIMKKDIKDSLSLIF